MIPEFKLIYWWSLASFQTPGQWLDSDSGSDSTILQSRNRPSLPLHGGPIILPPFRKMFLAPGSLSHFYLLPSFLNPIVFCFHAPCSLAFPTLCSLLLSLFSTIPQASQSLMQRFINNWSWTYWEGGVCIYCWWRSMEVHVTSCVLVLQPGVFETCVHVIIIGGQLFLNLQVSQTTLALGQQYLTGFRV